MDKTTFTDKQKTADDHSGQDSVDFAVSLYEQLPQVAEAAPRSGGVKSDGTIDFGSFDKLYGTSTDNAEGAPGLGAKKTKLDIEREKLEQNANSISDPNQRRDFLNYIADFEKRAKQLNLSDDEIEKTEAALNKLIEAKDGKLPTDQNLIIAQQLAYHLSNPSNIDQGFHGTCSAATLQERLFTTNPALAADMIVQGALSGQYTASDGKVIKLDPSNLLPGREELDRIPQDGNRSLASQIFQAVALNDVYQRGNPPLTYIQGRKGEKGEHDTGERLINSEGKVIADFGGIGIKDLNDEAVRLIGKKFVIDNTKAFGDGGMPFTTQAEMLNYIQQAKATGTLPLAIGVDANNPVFGPGERYAPMRSHVVSIADYDAANGKVRISNQWGEINDRWVTVDELYGATTRYGKDMEHKATPVDPWYKRIWPFGK